MQVEKPIRPWKHFFGYILCFILGGVVAALPRFPIFPFEASVGLTVVSELFRIPLTLLFFWWYTQRIVKVKLTGKVFNPATFKPLFWTGLGLILPVAMVAIFWLSGNLLDFEYRLMDFKGELITQGLMVSLATALAAGILEEVLFRGFLFEILHLKYGLGISALVPSLVFATLHLGPAKNGLDVIQILMAGTLVSLLFLTIYRRTGSIWNAAMVHVVWNFLVLNKSVAFVHVPEDLDTPIGFILTSNPLLSGGDFGVEASLPAMIVYVVVSLSIFKTFKPNEKKQS